MPARVLMVGADLTSNGGIASVVKTYHAQHLANGEPFQLDLLKTNYYKDRGKHWEAMIFARSSARLTRRLISRHPYELVHLHSSFGPSFVRKASMLLAAHARGVPTIIHLHSSAFDDFFMTERPALRKIISGVFHRADAVVVLCDAWAEKLSRHYPGVHVVKIPNPVALGPEPAPLQDKEQLDVLFMGFFIETKGVRDLLEVARKVRDAGSGMRFHLAGKGELQGHMEQVIRDEGLSDTVIIEGWVSGERKTSLLQECDVCFLPSYKEGMPIVLLEALAAGRALVSTTVAGIPELILPATNGLIREAGDVAGFVQDLLRLDGDRDLVRSMGEASREHARGFDTPVVWDQVVDLYRQLGASL